jgi:hypothetical protein
MRKILSVLAAGCTAFACVPFAAHADITESGTLPFELTAPENVSIVYLNGNDSRSTCEIHYSQNNSMSEWSCRKNDEPVDVQMELSEIGYEDMFIRAQIDWSLDSDEDWKCNDYWLTGGYDEEYKPRLGEWAYISESYAETTSMGEWIFRSMGNISDPTDTRWYGCHDENGDFLGWGDVLKDGQYKVDTSGDENVVWIDFSEHTMNVRVRWIVTARSLEGEDIVFTSDWSETASVGKDAVKADPIRPGDIEPPALSNLRYVDGDDDGHPIIAFSLDVTPEVAAQAAQVNGSYGSFFIYTYAKLAESQNWSELQNSVEVKSGDIGASLKYLAEIEGKIEAGTPIQVKARYYCSQPGQEDFFSDYSKVLTIDSVDMEVTTEKVSDTTAAPGTQTASAVTTASENKENKKCGVCGICPEPFGICLFILIAVVLVIAGGVIAAAVVMNRKKKSGPQTDKAPQTTAEGSASEASGAEEKAEGTEDSGESGKNA